MVPAIIDRSKLPPLYPTHLHDSAFWCSLGRAVATFGFLEEVLKKAVFALTGSCPAPSDDDERAAAIDEWDRLLQRSLVNPLNPLIDTFTKAAKDHPNSRLSNLDEFEEHLRDAARVRNVICHGSWGPPDENGASWPFYVTGKHGKQQEVVTPFTVNSLDQLREHTCELACEVVY